MIEAYPLSWPLGQPRSLTIERSRFGDHSLSVATKRVLKEIEIMRGREPIISSNIPLRRDGYPRADYERRTISDKGVAVYFTYKNQPVVLACDSWDCVEDNLWAIALSVEAMRGLDRWGVSEILDRAFTGFKALPQQATGNTCWNDLGIEQTKDKKYILHAFREAIKKAHESGETYDAGKLVVAKDEALRYAEQLN